MNKIIIITLVLLLIAGLFSGQARAYTITLIYRTGEPLMDEHLAILEDHDIVQLIYAGPDGLISPPNVYNGMPTGDDVLWEQIGIGDGADPGSGKFLDSIDYGSGLLGRKVYIRFFNASVMGQVSFYGLSDLHTLQELLFSGSYIDIWDMTDGGLYLWTVYPFIVIPEPETWLTLLPALVFAVFIYRKKKKKGHKRSAY